MTSPNDEYGWIHAAEPHRPSRATWGESDILDFAWCETCGQAWPCETTAAVAMDIEDGER